MKLKRLFILVLLMCSCMADGREYDLLYYNSHRNDELCSYEMVEKTTEAVFSYLENNLETIQSILMMFSTYEPLQYLNGSSKDVTFTECGNIDENTYENEYFEYSNVTIIQQKNISGTFDEELFEMLYTKVALMIRGFLYVVNIAVPGSHGIVVILGDENPMLVRYADEYYTKEYICSVKTNMYNTIIHDLLEKEEYEGFDWLYPRMDTYSGTLVTTFLGAGEVLGVKTLLTVDVEIQKLAQVILMRKPTNNGFYMVLGYDRKGKAKESGSIIAATNETVEIVMGGEYTSVQQIQSAIGIIPTLEKSVTGFKSVYDALSGKANYIVITTTNNVTYHVQWRKSAMLDCLLVTVIPIDELKASWEMKPPYINFFYAYNLKGDVINVTIEDTVIKNTGIYTLNWQIRNKNTNIVADKVYGTLAPSESTTIHYSIKNPHGERNSFIFEAFGANQNCYEILLIPLREYDISCTEDYYHAYLDKKCHGLTRTVYFEWNNGTQCQLGVALPGSEDIRCENLFDSEWFWPTIIVLDSLEIIFLIYLFVHSLFHKLEFHDRPAPHYYYLMLLSLFFATIFFPFGLSYGNETYCLIYSIIIAFCSILFQSIQLAILYADYVKYAQTHVLFYKESALLIRIVCVFFIAQAVFSGIWNDVTISVKETVADIDLYQTKCDKSLFFTTIPTIVISLANDLFVYKAFTAEHKMIKKVRYVMETIAVHSVITIIIIILYLVINNNLPAFADFMIEYCLILLCTISTHAYFPIYMMKSHKVKNIGEESTTVEEEKGMTNSKIIFSDPITRSYLKKFMAKFLQEESIIFWETINELEDVQDKLPREKKIEYCEEIYNKFIKEGSEMEININSTMRSKITNKKQKNPEDVSMFKSAKTEMEKLIVDNNFHNFISSDFGKKAEEVNNWFKSFQYLDDTVKKAIAEKVYLDRKTLLVYEYFNPPSLDVNSTPDKIEKVEKTSVSSIKSDNTKGFTTTTNNNSNETRNDNATPTPVDNQINAGNTSTTGETSIEIKPPNSPDSGNLALSAKKKEMRHVLSNGSNGVVNLPTSVNEDL